MSNKAVVIILSAIIATMVMAQTPGEAIDDNAPIAPTVPTTDRHQKGKVFLEKADILKADERLGNFTILVGNVEFRKEDMFMYCDSANLYEETNSIKAFGNVRMEQGDTLFVYADELDYNGLRELATLYADYGKKVRLINRDVELTTDVFKYDLSIDLGYYDNWGTLTDKRNQLTSAEGEYSPTTKDANFYTKVTCESVNDNNDTVYIYTDTLLYNTDTHIAMLTCPSSIVSKDGTIYTRDGRYDTNTHIGDLYAQSHVRTSNGNTLIGDTLIYDRNLGRGEAYGNVVMTDSVRQSSISGDYGFYNELTDSAFVTGHAMVCEYSRPDTLYAHGDTIRAFMLPDSTHITIMNPCVRIYRKDIQAICDSLTFTEADSLLHLNKHPVIWTGTRQIFGNIIEVHMNDSTVDRADLPDFGLMAEHLEDVFYNQLAGKEMVAFMDNGELRHLDVSGNVQGIFLPMENDSTYNKIFNIESSFMAVDFAGDTIQRAKLWSETSGTGTPLYLAKKSLYFLPQFKWFETMRPTSPMDVFNRPPEMMELFAQPDPANPKILHRKKNAKKDKDDKNKKEPVMLMPGGAADESGDASENTPSEETDEAAENTNKPESTATAAENEDEETKLDHNPTTAE